MYILTRQLSISGDVYICLLLVIFLDSKQPGFNVADCHTLCRFDKSKSQRNPSAADGEILDHERRGEWTHGSKHTVDEPLKKIWLEE